MISERLRQARQFEALHMPGVPAGDRPVFHVTGGVGWINDPNGFSRYKGEYHLFYQYHPYSTQWGPMHWGHVKTRDFLRWERLPVALAPDRPYDRDGCFSGGAVELDDGRQLLLYTGVRREDGAREYQTQCVAIGDGVDYEKYGDNPVLTAAALPPGGSPADFRDPKIWREPDGLFRAVAGNRAADGTGAVLLFESDDALRWRPAGVIDQCRGAYGRMWECPDFFPLDGRQVLVVSPEEMAARGLEFHAGNGTLGLIGDWDSEARRFTRERVQPLDYGIDFYAAQSLLSYDGRRIMIAWMQNWTAARCLPRSARIFGEMTLPRELSIRDGRLVQCPVRELERYHGRRAAYRDVLVAGETRLPDVGGRVLDMTVDVRPEGGMYHAFRLNVAQGGEYVTYIRYRPEGDVVRVDRSLCGARCDVVHMREFPVRHRNGRIKLRLVMDRHSLELFVNDGEQTATFLLYAPEQADAVSFQTEGGAVRMDVEKYELAF